MPVTSHAQIANLPVPGMMVSLSPGYQPALIQGIRIFPNDPLKFDFIVDIGDDALSGEELKEQSSKMIKYFLAALTVPEDELWVNLSPYEEDRIIPEEFGFTEMGRDLLAQDYLLKQITATMMYPEKELGHEFWERVYARAQMLLGTTDIPVNTFNKVWIVPDKAEVYEGGDKAIVVDSRLKVMLEADYKMMKDANSAGDADLHPVQSDILADDSQGAVQQIIRDIIIPELEKEVNEGKNFANLRQIYNAMILATWFKRNLKESLLGKIYLDQNKVTGVDIEDKNEKYKIYERYVEAFRKGVYSLIKEEYDPQTQSIIPRKYFSGGVAAKELFALGSEVYSTTERVDRALGAVDPDRAMLVTSDFREADEAGALDNSMLAAGVDLQRQQQNLERLVGFYNKNGLNQPRSVRFGQYSPVSDEKLQEEVFPLFRKYLNSAERFLDLGHGDARVVILAALMGADAKGIELDQEIFDRSVELVDEFLIALREDGVIEGFQKDEVFRGYKWNLDGQGVGSIELIRNDFTMEDISQYDTIFRFGESMGFLVNTNLWAKVVGQTKKGAIAIELGVDSNIDKMPDPLELLEEEDGLRVYRSNKDRAMLAYNAPSVLDPENLFLDSAFNGTEQDRIRTVNGKLEEVLNRSGWTELLSKHEDRMSKASIFYRLDVSAYQVDDTIEVYPPSNDYVWYLLVRRDSQGNEQSIEVTYSEAVDLVSFLKGNELEQVTMPNQKGVVEKSFWGEQWRLEDNVAYNSYQTTIHPQVASVVSGLIANMRAQGQRDFRIVDIFGGDGTFLRTLNNRLQEQGQLTENISFSLVEQNQDALEYSEIVLRDIENVSVFPWDIVGNAALPQAMGEQSPQIVTAIGGLNAEVIKRDEAFVSAREVFRILDPGGFFVVSGISNVLLNRDDFEGMGFEVLNMTVPKRVIVNTSPQEVYILRKPSESIEVRGLAQKQKIPFEPVGVDYAMTSQEENRGQAKVIEPARENLLKGVLDDSRVLDVIRQHFELSVSEEIKVTNVVPITSESTYKDVYVVSFKVQGVLRKAALNFHRKYINDEQIDIGPRLAESEVEETQKLPNQYFKHLWTVFGRDDFDLGEDGWGLATSVSVGEWVEGRYGTQVLSELSSIENRRDAVNFVKDTVKFAMRVWFDTRDESGRGYVHGDESFNINAFVLQPDNTMRFVDNDQIRKSDLRVFLGALQRRFANNIDDGIYTHYTVNLKDQGVDIVAQAFVEVVRSLDNSQEVIDEIIELDGDRDFYVNTPLFNEIVDSFVPFGESALTDAAMLGMASRVTRTAQAREFLLDFQDRNVIGPFTSDFMQAATSQITNKLLSLFPANVPDALVKASIPYWVNVISGDGDVSVVFGQAAGFDPSKGEVILVKSFSESIEPIDLERLGQWGDQAESQKPPADLLIEDIRENIRRFEFDHIRIAYALEHISARPAAFEALRKNRDNGGVVIHTSDPTATAVDAIENFMKERPQVFPVTENVLIVHPSIERDNAMLAFNISTPQEAKMVFDTIEALVNVEIDDPLLSRLNIGETENARMIRVDNRIIARQSKVGAADFMFTQDAEYKIYRGVSSVILHWNRLDADQLVGQTDEELSKAYSIYLDEDGSVHVEELDAFQIVESKVEYFAETLAQMVIDILEIDPDELQEMVDELAFLAPSEKASQQQLSEEDFKKRLKQQKNKIKLTKQIDNQWEQYKPVEFANEDESVKKTLNIGFQRNIKGDPLSYFGENAENINRVSIVETEDRKNAFIYVETNEGLALLFESADVSTEDILTRSVREAGMAEDVDITDDMRKEVIEHFSGERGSRNQLKKILESNGVKNTTKLSKVLIDNYDAINKRDNSISIETADNADQILDEMDAMSEKWAQDLGAVISLPVTLYQGEGLKENDRNEIKARLGFVAQFFEKYRPGFMEEFSTNTLKGKKVEFSVDKIKPLWTNTLRQKADIRDSVFGVSSVDAGDLMASSLRSIAVVENQADQKVTNRLLLFNSTLALLDDDRVADFIGDVVHEFFGSGYLFQKTLSEFERKMLFSWGNLEGQKSATKFTVEVLTSMVTNEELQEEAPFLVGALIERLEEEKDTLKQLNAMKEDRAMLATEFDAQSTIEHIQAQMERLTDNEDVFFIRPDSVADKMMQDLVLGDDGLWVHLHLVEAGVLDSTGIPAGDGLLFKIKEIDEQGVVFDDVMMERSGEIGFVSLDDLLERNLVSSKSVTMLVDMANEEYSKYTKEILDGIRAAKKRIIFDLQSFHDPVNDIEVSDMVFVPKEDYRRDKVDQIVTPLLERTKRVGGIDLNPSQLDIKRSGSGVNVNVPAADIRLDEEINIKGLTPVIIQIVPITNLPLQLGFVPQSEKDTPYALSSSEPIAYLKEF